MLHSITEDTAHRLVKLANELGIKKSQIVSVINNGSTLSMVYADDEK
jgi:plasmid maintenance system antidote protein VapI